MRVLFLVAALWTAGTLHAADWAFNDSTFTVDVNDPSAIAPLDFHFAFDWPGIGPISYTLNDLTPADLFREWTIDASNAGSFGVDWNTLADYSLNHWPGPVPIHPITGEWLWYEPTSTIDTPLGTFPRGVCCGFSFLPLREDFRQTGVMLESLRLRVMNFNYHPGEGVVYFAVGTWLNGTASQSIPEPSAGTLGLFAIVIAGYGRHRFRFSTSCF